MTRTDAIENAATHICTCREFCGDEKQAVSDWCADNGILFSVNFYRAANFRANAIWNSWQRQAGVPEKYLF